MIGMPMFYPIDTPNERSPLGCANAEFPSAGGPRAAKPRSKLSIFERKVAA